MAPPSVSGGNVPAVTVARGQSLEEERAKVCQAPGADGWSLRGSGLNPHLARSRQRPI
ncbi:hypothetical protein VULLAG_LOCUS1353 [Vulpes lagopus]